MTLLTRRTALGLAGLAVASPWVAKAAEAKPVTVALDWTPNTNHVGLFVAKRKGLFSKAGLDVTILPYSDTAAGTLVGNRRADFGVAGVGFYRQRASGADLKAVYGVVQHDTGRLVVSADRTDIKSLKDLDGLTYAGFGSAWETALIGSMIRFAGGQGQFKTVTLGTSAYEALANRIVDFTLEIETWEGVEAALAGDKLRAFRYSDYGVPDLQTTLLISSDAFLSASPNVAKAFVAAALQGYADAADHPDEAADILIAENPDALTKPELVHASMKALVEGHYLRREDGTIGVVDPARNVATGTFLFKSAILADGNGTPLTAMPDFSTYISNDYLPK